MSGSTFIALVVMILILLFIIMSIGPLVSAFYNENVSRME
jgi:hypothetical protein